MNKPNLTKTEFDQQVADIAAKLPFLSDEQKWGIVYACWLYNQSNPEATKTVSEYIEFVIGSSTDSYYTKVVEDKQAWIAQISADPAMTVILLGAAQLPENAGKSLSEIASGLPFLYNME